MVVADVRARVDEYLLAGSIADPPGIAVTAGAGNGGLVGSAGLESTVLRVVNASGAAGTVTVKSGSSPLAPVSALGPLTVAVGNGQTVWVGPFESGRFEQPDSSLWFESSVALTVTAFRMPRHP